MNTPTIIVRTMNKGRQNEFDRAYLYCPSGHEVVSAPVTSTATGRRIMDGDFTREECGYGSCGWKGVAGSLFAGEMTPGEPCGWWYQS